MLNEGVAPTHRRRDVAATRFGNRMDMAER